MKRLKQALFVCAALTTAVALFYAIENWRGQRHYQKVYDELTMAGEELVFANRIPATVPAQENFGSAAFLQALDDDQAHPECQAAYESLRHLEEAESLEDFEILAKKHDSQLSLQEAFAPWQDARAELVDRLSLPYARWNRSIAPDVRADEYSVYHISILWVMKLTMLQARAHLLMEKPVEALEDIEIGLRLGEMCVQEPGLIFHVLFLADLALMTVPIEDGLRLQVWNEKELGRLEARLEGIDFSALYRQSLQGERASALTFRPSAGDKQFLKEVLGEDYHWKYRLMPRGWTTRGFAQVMETIQKGADQFSTKLNLGEQVAHWERELEKAREIRTWPMAQSFLLAQTGVSRAVLDTARKVALQRAAIAIERYRLAHGMLPPDLDALAEPPRDPRNGESLAYVRTPRGYLVRSGEGEEAVQFPSL